MKQNLFDRLEGIPLTSSEHEWLERRFEDMTAAERVKFAGALKITGAETAQEVIQTASQLHCFELYLDAGDLSGLGECTVNYLRNVPEKVRPYLDMEKAGRAYQEEYGGAFAEGHFVRQRKELDLSTPVELETPPASGYAMRVRLASPGNAEGVWMGFPDWNWDWENSRGNLYPDEVQLALRELGVDGIEQCQILEAECWLPQLEDIPSQYDSIAGLVRHAAEFGRLWFEDGGLIEGFLEKWQTVVELEGCTRLDLAVDLAHNLECYDFIPKSIDLETYGREKAARDGVLRNMDEFVLSCFDGAAYAREYARQCGMSETEHGYAARNGGELRYEYSQPPQQGPEMTM